MDDKLKLIGVGIAIGVIIAVLLFKVLGAEPNVVSIGLIEFELPTATPINNLSEESNSILESGNETQSSSPSVINENSYIPSNTETSWYGEYYDNAKFEGVPIGIRNDAFIDFDWNDYSPISEVGENDFSIRWTGCFEFNEGQYTFKALADDNIEVWLDDTIHLINASSAASGERRMHEIQYDIQGGNHCLKVEYKEYLGAAVVFFEFEEN